jgi:hypothetical protein
MRDREEVEGGGGDHTSILNQIHNFLGRNRASKLQTQCHRFQVEMLDQRLASSINKTEETTMIP